jgi:hypothetical protein
LKRFEPEPLASFQAIWPQHNIVKVTVMPRLNNQDARGAIRRGGMFRVIHCEKVQGRQNT